MRVPGILLVQGVRRETPDVVGGTKEESGLIMIVGLCSTHTAGPDLPFHPPSQEIWGSYRARPSPLCLWNRADMCTCMINLYIDTYFTVIEELILFCPSLHQVLICCSSALFSVYLFQL